MLRSGPLPIRAPLNPTKTIKHTIPPALQPLLRAYVYGYASSIGPRLSSLLFKRLSRRSKGLVKPDDESIHAAILRILKGGLELNRFPTFCAVIVGGSTLLQLPLRVLFARLVRGLSRSDRERYESVQISPNQSGHWRLLIFFPSITTMLAKWLTRCVAAFIAGWFSMKLLQTKETDAFIEKLPPGTFDPKTGAPLKQRRLAGRTLDLTIFAAARAFDVIVNEWWTRRRAQRVAAGKWTNVDSFLASSADPLLFSLSSALIMWAWIYDSERLPPAYNRWVTGAAAVDNRLVLAIRAIRSGKIVYGRASSSNSSSSSSSQPPEDPSTSTSLTSSSSHRHSSLSPSSSSSSSPPSPSPSSSADLLRSMCADYGWPLSWADPLQTRPFPCEIVHMGHGPSCEWHLATRFLGGFRHALSMYLPLNLALVVRRPSARAARRALLSSARSSAFLGAFIALYYYGICLARTRVGPRLLLPRGRHPRDADHAEHDHADHDHDHADHDDHADAVCQTLDGGVCIGAGCALCGWSILLEDAGRRKDVALFVAPRAVAALVPRTYPAALQWRETALFAASTAVVATALQERPEAVRGVFGKLLGNVLGGR